MDTNIIDRVRSVMDASQLPNAAFAAAIATTPDKLSKSLAGTRRFTTTELALVAELGHTTIEWLLDGVEKRTPLMAARTTTASARDSEGIEKLASRFTNASDQLSRLADSPRDLQPLPVLSNDWSAVAQGERLAISALDMIRRAHQTADAAASLPEVVEAVFDIDVAVVDMPDGLDGCAWQTDQQRLILIPRTSKWARQRFSFAHELGHVLASDAQELIAEEIQSGSDRVKEMRANAFAAAFLMPEDELVKRCNGALVQKAEFIDLVNHYLVSPRSMFFRLSNLQLISAEHRSWGGMTAEACAVSGGKPELLATERNKSEAERLPPRLVAEHLKLFWADRTSARPLAALLNMEPAAVIDLFRPSVSAS